MLITFIRVQILTVLGFGSNIFSNSLALLISVSFTWNNLKTLSLSGVKRLRGGRMPGPEKKNQNKRIQGLGD